MTYLTWSEDNTGHLYKKEGAWRFDIPPEEFKNEIGAAEHGYRMIVYKLLWPMIDRYLNDYRPLLRRPDSNRFFIS